MNKKLQKLISLTLCALMVLVVLVGCTDDGKNKNGGNINIPEGETDVVPMDGDLYEGEPDEGIMDEGDIIDAEPTADAPEDIETAPPKESEVDVGGRGNDENGVLMQERFTISDMAAGDMLLGMLRESVEMIAGKPAKESPLTLEDGRETTICEYKDMTLTYLGGKGDEILATLEITGAGQVGLRGFTVGGDIAQLVNTFPDEDEFTQVGADTKDVLHCLYRYNTMSDAQVMIPAYAYTLANEAGMVTLLSLAYTLDDLSYTMIDELEARMGKGEISIAYCEVTAQNGKITGMIFDNGTLIRN